MWEREEVVAAGRRWAFERRSFAKTTVFVTYCLQKVRRAIKKNLAFDINHNAIHFHPPCKNIYINTNISAPEALFLNSILTPSCTQGYYGECLQHSKNINFNFYTDVTNLDNYLYSTITNVKFVGAEAGRGSEPAVGFCEEKLAKTKVFVTFCLQKVREIIFTFLLYAGSLVTEIVKRHPRQIFSNKTMTTGRGNWGLVFHTMGCTHGY